MHKRYRVAIRCLIEQNTNFAEPVSFEEIMETMEGLVHEALDESEQIEHVDGEGYRLIIEPEP